MTLIRAEGIALDEYTSIADDQPLASGKLLMSWARWLQESDKGNADARLVGLVLPNTLDLQPLGHQLKEHPLLALEFPSFPDGRSYSQARLLRDRIGFTGELRALGQAVVLDQIVNLHRCGFDSFELREDQKPSDCIRALNDAFPPYQPAADHKTPIRLIRRRQSAPSS